MSTHKRAGFLLKLMLGLLFVAAGLLLPAQDTSSKAQSSTAEKPSGEPQVVQRNFPSTSEPTFTPVELRTVSTPVTLNLDGDAKSVYEALGKAAGFSVIFDPDYVSRPIHAELHRVPFREALETVAFESKTFWRPVTPTTLFVAADNMSKRRELEQSVIKVFYLPHSPTQTELQDTANTLRTILDITRVQPLPQGAVTVRGTPDQIALAGKLIEDMNKPRPKPNRYRVEIRVSEMEGQTRVNSRSYRLFLQPNQSQRLNIVPRVPVQAGSSAAADRNKAAQDSVATQNIDCTISSETEQEVSLNIRGTFSDFVSAQSDGHGDDVRQFSIDARPVLTLDKPTVINSFDDPATKRTVQVELTVTRLPES